MSVQLFAVRTSLPQNKTKRGGPTKWQIALFSPLLLPVDLFAVVVVLLFCFLFFWGAGRQSVRQSGSQAARHIHWPEARQRQTEFIAGRDVFVIKCLASAVRGGVLIIHQLIATTKATFNSINIPRTFGATNATSAIRINFAGLRIGFASVGVAPTDVAKCSFENIIYFEFFFQVFHYFCVVLLLLAKRPEIMQTSFEFSHCLHLTLVFVWISSV